MESSDIVYIENWIKGKVDDKEFKSRLEKDKDFHEIFVLYMAVMKNIEKEVEQNNADVKYALSHISDEDARSLKLLPIERPIFNKRPVFKWMSFVSGAAAMFVIAIGGFFVQKGNYDSTTNAIVADLGYGEMPNTMGDNEPYDLNTKTVNQIKGDLPKLEKEWATAIANKNDLQDIADFGQTLAFAYLKLNERSKACEVFTKVLAAISASPEDYQPDINKITTILKYLQ